jgi:predicted PurR-regulated permease PerM
MNGLAGTIGRQALGLGTTLIGTVVSGLAVLLVTFYLVADGPRLRWQLSRRLEPARQKEFLRVWELAIAKTGGYVYSRVLLAVVSAAVHVVAFQFAGLPYAIALGVWVGIVSSVIPVVGLYIAGVLPVVVALANPESASVLVVLVVITVYQQIENYLIQPRITAYSLSLHPAVAFLSVLVGAALLGPVGALLALPAAAIVAALITSYAEEHDVMEHGLTNTPASRVETRTSRRRRRRDAGSNT